MEILEFIFGCLEMLSARRLAMMIAIGCALGAASLTWVRPEPVAIILAVVGFVGCAIIGVRWQRSAE